MVGRFENFLRDAARDHAPCCGKGQRIVVAAIFKTFFKNARIGTRTHAGEELSQRGSNPRAAESPWEKGSVSGVSLPQDCRKPLSQRQCLKGFATPELPKTPGTKAVSQGFHRTDAGEEWSQRGSNPRQTAKP